jgi:haloalkane dehalogenase
MGDSEKLPDGGRDSYRFVEHRRYLEALLEALNVRERATLVIHDWGSTLGFDWANHHRDAVRGIAYMEAMVGRQYWDHWDKFGMRPVLQALRSEAGEQMVLQDNFFIEKVLPGAILRKLSDVEMTEYRRPFAEPGEGRRPTLTFPSGNPYRRRSRRRNSGRGRLRGLAEEQQCAEAVPEGRARWNSRGGQGS